MIEKKFSIPLILMSVVSLIFGAVISFPVEGAVISLITIILSVKKRDRYLVKIPIVLACIGMIIGLGFLAFQIYLSIREGYPASSYWFIELLFGKVEK